MTGDRYEPNRFLGFPISRNPQARPGDPKARPGDPKARPGDPKARQGDEEPQRFMGMPVDWFGPLDKDRFQFQSLAHPIRRYQSWLRRRRSGPYLTDEDESRPGG